MLPPWAHPRPCSPSVKLVKALIPSRSMAGVHLAQESDLLVQGEAGDQIVNALVEGQAEDYGRARSRPRLASDESCLQVPGKEFR